MTRPIRDRIMTASQTIERGRIERQGEERAYAQCDEDDVEHEKTPDENRISSYVRIRSGFDWEGGKRI